MTKRRSASIVSRDRVLELLDYDRESGLFTWRVSRGPLIAGSVAGNENTSGHIQIQIDGRAYLAHRLAWLIVSGQWPQPPNEIDHRDTDKQNNRWSNLREATRSQNRMNTRRVSTNTSGFKGAQYFSPGKWRAILKKDGKTVSLGLHNSPEEAHAAYCEGIKRHFGEFARAT